jgi:hypothetical protein
MFTRKNKKNNPATENRRRERRSMCGVEELRSEGTQVTLTQLLERSFR